MEKVIHKKCTKTILRKTNDRCTKTVDNTSNPIYNFREALVHKICQISPFLPKTYSVNIKDDKLTIEMELLEKKLKDPTPENKLKAWKNVLQAVALLNFFGIAHRDIKSENIMYRNGVDAVLIDFGLSKTLGDENGFHTPNIVSEFYRSPELDPELEVQQYGYEVDSWSLGIFALELWCKDFDQVEFMKTWRDEEPLDAYFKDIPEKIVKIVRSFLLTHGQRKVARDWVNIDSQKCLFTFPPDLQVNIPHEFKEWEVIFKSIYWSMKQHFGDDKMLIPLTMLACCNLICPIMDAEDIAEEYKIKQHVLQSKVLDWFVQWKITKK